MTTEVQLELPSRHKKKHKSLFVASQAWSAVGDDKNDYTYSQLLDRIYNNYTIQELVEEKDVVLSAPIVERAGSKKTRISNFAIICSELNRPLAHLLSFFVAELRMQCSINQNYQLVIVGRLQQKHIKTVIKKYVLACVMCKSCKECFKTELIRENRLTYLFCNTCHTRTCISDKLE